MTMATPKYKKLVEAYAPQIAQLRELKAADEAAKDALDAHWRRGDLEDADFSYQSNRLAEAWDAAHYEYMLASESITTDIEAEYNDVPFAQARQAGIEGFWNAANI